MALTSAALAAVIFAATPLPSDLFDRSGFESIRITDRHGVLLREIHSTDDGRSIALSGEIPVNVRNAFVAAEDKRFGRHFGVDPLAIGRAVISNVRAQRVVSGASTIAQQLWRQLYPRERSLTGKLYEAVGAIRLTAQFSGEEILRAYLDRIPLGNNTVGIEAAAQLYFGRSAAALSLGQAAMLAGLAGAPARYDPFRHAESAHRRMGLILARMQRLGFINDEDIRVAMTTSIDLTKTANAFQAPHFIEQLLSRMPQLKVTQASTIQTTIDLALQRDVEEIIRTEISSERRMSQAAAIVVDNPTGEILAYVGSADFFDAKSGGQNDGVRSPRQPGSALKPFVYGLALSKHYTPATLLRDVDSQFETPSGDYVPQNYDRRSHGPVRLRAALANSYNVPAVQVAEDLGPAQMLSVLHAAGFESLDRDASHYGVGLVLGNGDVTLRELARAYRGLARGGKIDPLVDVCSAAHFDGTKVVPAAEIKPRRFLSHDVAALLIDILSDESARSPAFGLDNALRLPFTVAAKTGTSRAYVDNWTVGFTKEVTVAVWAGNFDGTAMQHVSGISGAGPIFARIIKRAMQDIRPAPLVDRHRLDRASICPLSGLLAGPACVGGLGEIFLPGTAPTRACAMHRFDSQNAVHDESSHVSMRKIVDVGTEYYAWAKAEGLNPIGGAETSPRDSMPNRAGPPRLIVPKSGDEFLLDPGVPLSAHTIPVRLRMPSGVTHVELHLDHQRVQMLHAPFETWLPVASGDHRLEIWLPQATAPALIAEFQVKGGG